VVHVVCSGAFAGVERSVSASAAAVAAAGVAVTVVGGEPRAMRAALPDGVGHLPAARPLAAARALVGSRRDVALVHAHMTEAEAVAVACRPLVRRPVVGTLHFARARGSTGLRARLWRGLPRLLAAQVAVSDYARQAAGPAAVVIPNAVPDPGPPADPGGRRPVVLVAQRFEPEKRTAVALEAWAASGLAQAGWTMELAGDGAEADQLARRAAALGLGSSVRFTGYARDLPQQMARAGVFLATSPIDSFGLSVVEAMAAGLPVVAAAGGGHLETVGPVTDRYLFAPGDGAGAGAALAALAADPAARVAYAHDLRRRFLDQYTLERHATRLLALYRSVSTGHGPGAESLPDRGGGNRGPATP
jgi:glycosyltransferase involved in cell wall biosynthesis